MLQTMVWVKFQVEGFHYYANAPEDVSYLRDMHRHMFHYTVGIEVKGDDREIEFHQLRNYLMSLFRGGMLHANGKSCEMLAKDVLNNLLAHPRYGTKTNHVYEITVSEDGECGATVTYA